MKLFAVLIVGLFSFSCTQQVASSAKVKATADQSSIINGTPVTAENQLAKSVVGLMMKLDKDSSGTVWIQSCTGSILNAKFILTAAHCVIDSEAAELLVHFSLNTVTYAGQKNSATRIDVEKTMVTRKVKAFVTHPEYTGSGSHDLALLMLADEIPAETIPVKLLPAQYLNADTALTTFEGLTLPVILMGFGVVSEIPTATEVLRETTVPSKFVDRFVVTDQTKGSGGCNGDSGGPAFLLIDGVHYQVGVTHGPREGSTTCHEEGEWYNPAFDQGFLIEAQEKMQKGMIN